MSELLKYLNAPLTRADASNTIFQQYAVNWQNKNARVVEILNNFNDDDETTTTTSNESSKLKQKMANVKIPFKNHQKLNMKWCRDELSSDDVSTLFTSDMRSVMFHPYKSFGTCAVRGDMELKKNAYTYWQMTVSSDRLYGTSIMFGVGTKRARLSSIGYLNLLGVDEHSWGLSHKGIAWHSNKSKHFCSPLAIDNNKCEIRIGCLYDGYRKTLSYFINDVYMGIAFENVDASSTSRMMNKRMKLSNENDTEEGTTSGGGGGGGLYPMISSTVSQSCIKIDCFYQTFPSLQDICRTNVTKNNTLFNSIRMEYPYLPKFIIEYLED